MAEKNQNTSIQKLISVKLKKPYLKAGLVLRRDLLSRLNSGLRHNDQLFLISAPSGYGKTTLVCQWMNNKPCRHIWLSLDEKDNDPVRFLTYLINAFRKIAPEIGKVTWKFLRSGQMLSVDLLVSPLINDLTVLNGHLIVVLDDYHLIHNRFIHDIIQFILDSQPFLLHIVLIADEDPLLDFSRARFGGLITELRVDDFRFSEAETAVFMAGMIGLNLEIEVVTLFNIITEGRIAGLQMAALAIQGLTPEGIVDFILEISCRHWNIINYLLSKVLANLSKEVRNFLQQTVILDRLCGPLCNVITGREDSQEFLELLQHSNLFLLPLDKRHEWYEYHPLFAGLLQARLSEGERQVLQQRAADWYSANCYSDKTIEQSNIMVDYREIGHFSYLLSPGCYYLVDKKPPLEEFLPEIRAAAPRVNTEISVTSGTPSFTILINSLSDREMELLRLVAAGLSNEEISREMTISLNTTKYHLKSIYRKLSVNSRTKAAMKAKELNLA